MTTEHPPEIVEYGRRQIAELELEIPALIKERDLAQLRYEDAMQMVDAFALVMRASRP